MFARSSLLLDIGNTSIKYAWYTFENHIADLQVMRTTLQSLDELISMADNCWLCSVVDEVTNQQVKSTCRQNNTRIFEVHTQASQFGVSNAYPEPDNMGCDRWMAIIAGASLCDKGELTNYLAIDAGTAITCDFVMGNRHLGGWIAPGLRMARMAVVNQTKNVFDYEQSMSILTLGKNTPECVANGALAQQLGVLSHAINIMQQKCTKFEIFISGGDAPLLINAFNEIEKNKNKVNINYIENLVLIGLAKIAHEYLAKNG